MIVVDVVSSVNVAGHFSDAFIEIVFAPLMCTNQASVCGLVNTVHFAKEVLSCFLVRGRSGFE